MTASLSPTVMWTDVSPRDGLQNLDADVPTEVKVELIRGLLAAGVPRVEATSFVSPRWVPRMADAAAVLAGVGAGGVESLRVLVPNLKGLELALEHGVRGVVVTIGATETFNQRNVNRSIAASLDEVEAICGLSREHAVRVDVALSVAFGCPYEGVVDAGNVRALARELRALGCAEVDVADTIGVAVPGQVSDLCGALVDDLGSPHIGLHVHDTRGLGVANCIAAYGAGVRRFEGSTGGLGGCPFAPRATGNVATEDAVLGLRGAGAEDSIDLDALCRVAADLSTSLDRALPGRLHRAGVWHPEHHAHVGGDPLGRPSSELTRG